ncbi:hypothetical protein BJ138DRAFT_1087708 [Hygrophoropsis aurantiaca]|uniref:Uncharacterized protein n=1 Tax=Hygrophoropsis aurantiaca TaxID=72124 RepID=A0ACB8AAE9_9AGAM|nr:hypothetical protein BJ138DRAFT_1087708 [Hygrophoropsis aurantiaca]
MPFLSRRSSALSGLNEPANFPPNSRLADTPIIRKQTSSDRVFQRVTTLFSSRKKRESNPSRYGPQSHIAIPNSGRISRSSSNSSSPVSPDIRRPSGLGRRASSLEVEPPYTYPFVPSGDYSETIRGRDAKHPTTRNSPICALPDEILASVLHSLPPNDLPSVALVSRVLCTVARISLYTTLDSSVIHSERVDSLFHVLATNQELAEIVHTFICHSWPASIDDTALADPTHESDFFVALRKMRNIVALSVPSFPSVLVQATLPQNINISRLQQLTITSRTLTKKEQTDILTSLPYYPQLSSLSFPNLMDSVNDMHALNETPYIPPGSSDVKIKKVPIALQTSRILLKSLKSVQAPPELAITIANLLWTPLHRITLDIHSTLYTGLRPAAVARALKGVSEMKVVFGKEVDKRTAEKFLGAVGVALADNPSENTAPLTVLEVEAEWTDEEAADILYKIIDSVMSRFRGLRKLKITTLCRSPQTQSLPALPHNFPFPPLPSPTSSTRSSLAMSISSQLGQALTQEFVGQGAEKMHAKLWTKQCPSLKDIAFTFSTAPSSGIVQGFEEEDAESVIYGIWFRRKV